MEMLLAYGCCKGSRLSGTLHLLEVPRQRYMLETAPDLRHVTGSGAVAGACVCAA